ncbi:MAG: dTMP kinase [Fimbriimonadaceae bacterium]|nr:MAG: dTMP kinase [Fimbriimonadaceae bacterium]
MFITLEGPEGAGKSTVIAGLAERFTELGREVITTREPGAGEFGQRIRTILLEGEDMPAESELFLFLADRANHVVNLIQPSLNDGKVVICDRHAESTLVYQGYARGLDKDFLRKANLTATRGLRPDLILLLDLDVEVGLSRQTSKDRLDLESLEFHQKVRAGFLSEARNDLKRWAKIDAAQNPEQVLEDCWAAVQSRLLV